MTVSDHDAQLHHYIWSQGFHSLQEGELVCTIIVIAIHTDLPSPKGISF